MAKTYYMRSRWSDPLEELEGDPIFYEAVEAALCNAGPGDYVHKLIIETNYVVVHSPTLGELVE